MSNTQRPTIAKKHTNSSEAKRKQELDESFGIRIDGVDYILTPADVTGLQEMRIRKESGYSVTSLIRELSIEPGVDHLGIFMWVCNLTQGKPADLEAILEGVSMASEVEIIDSAEPALPKA